MGKYTPGPWEVVFNSPNKEFQILDKNLMVQAVTRNQYNAQLISTAPELLEQVKQALKFCRDEGIDETWEYALEKVIARAEGK